MTWSFLTHSHVTWGLRILESFLDLLNQVDQELKKAKNELSGSFSTLLSPSQLKSPPR